MTGGAGGGMAPWGAADYVVVKKAIDDRCPAEGPGPWIGYPYGDVVEDETVA